MGLSRRDERHKQTEEEHSEDSECDLRNHSNLSRAIKVFPAGSTSTWRENTCASREQQASSRQGGAHFEKKSGMPSCTPVFGVAAWKTARGPKGVRPQ